MPGMPAQNKVGVSTVLCRGLHSMSANWLPTSFLIRFSSSRSSLHAITLQWQRTEASPKLCASFRYSSIHSLLIWFERLYRESECMFFAIFSNFCRLAALSSINTYWFSMWLHGRSSPTGEANDKRQSLRSVESFSYRMSVVTLPGKSSTSERVCRQRILSPIRISSAPSDISLSVVVSVCEREKYFSTIPAVCPVPTISSVVNRWSLTNPLSFMIEANCPTASMNFTITSLSLISFGTMNPRHSVLKLLCVRLRSLVVLVRNR